MEELRKQFEAWIENEHGFHGIDIEWHQTRNCYAQFGIHLAWSAWQASRAAIEIELPDEAFYPDGDIDCPLVVNLDDVKNACRATGVKLVTVGEE